MWKIFKKKPEPEVKEEPKIEVKPEKYSQSVYQYLSNKYYSENATKILKLIDQAKALSINPSEICGVNSSEVFPFAEMRYCLDKYQKLLGATENMIVNKLMGGVDNLLVVNLYTLQNSENIQHNGETYHNMKLKWVDTCIDLNNPEEVKIIKEISAFIKSSKIKPLIDDTAHVLEKNFSATIQKAIFKKKRPSQGGYSYPVIGEFQPDYVVKIGYLLLFFSKNFKFKD